MNLYNCFTFLQMLDACKMYGDVWRKEKLINCPNLELDNIVYAKEGDVQRDILLVSISGQSYVCQGNIVYNAMV